MGDIPVHIGVRDLKLTGILAVAHKYTKWTNGLILRVDDVELRSATWEEYLPRAEGANDIDAIASRFFKIVRGKRKFERGKKPLELVLALPYDLYETALAHREEAEDRDGVSKEMSKVCGQIIM